MNKSSYYFIPDVLTSEEIKEIQEHYKDYVCDHYSVISDKWNTESEKMTRMEAPNRYLDLIGIPENKFPSLTEKIKKSFQKIIKQQVSLEGPHYYCHYHIGDFHGLHRDNYATHFSRDLAIIIHLSDPTEYEGGELIVNNEITPRQKGAAIIFDTSQLHELTKVTKGDRYIISECAN